MCVKLMFYIKKTPCKIKFIIYFYFIISLCACYNINQNLSFKTDLDTSFNSSLDTITLLVFEYDPPFTYKDSEGKISGFYSHLAKNISNKCKVPCKIKHLSKENLFRTLYKDSTVVALGVYDIPIYRRDFLLSSPYASTEDAISPFYDNGINLKEYLKLNRNTQSVAIRGVPICLAANKYGQDVFDIVNEVMLDLKEHGKIEKLKDNNFIRLNIDTDKIILYISIIFGILVSLLLAYIISKIVKQQRKHLASVDEYAILIGKIIPIGIIIVRSSKKNQTDRNFYFLLKKLFTSKNSKYNKRIFYCSENFKHFFNDKNPTLKDVLDIFSLRRREEIIKISEDVFKTGKIVKFYEKFHFPNQKDSESLITIKRIFLNSEYYIFTTISNVTDLRNAQNLASENNKKMDNFLSIINHEIRTPLNTIVGFSNILNELSENEKPSIIKLISEKSNQLSGMISNILIYAKLQSGTFTIILKKIDIVQILQMRKLKFHDKYNDKKNVNLKLYIPFDTYTIESDFTVISYLYKVLLSNAENFTENGEILYGFNCIEENTVLFVKDSGKGISYKDANIVFERFSKVDIYTQGLGIGMSIALELTKLLPDGKIGFYSELGKGSTFWVSFSICDDRVSCSENLSSEVQLLSKNMYKGKWYEKDENGIMVLRGGNNE